MKDNPTNLQHPMEKEAFITMVEDAIKDVLADEEIVEYMSDLITKRLLMLMKEKAFQKIVENVVDQVVGDLRQVMSKQVQSFIKERINIGFMGNGDTDNKNAAEQQEDNKDAASEETNIIEEFDKGMTLFVNEKELSKQTLNKIKNNVTYDHAEVDFCAESAKAKLKDKKRIEKHVVNLVTETVLDKDQIGNKQVMDDEHAADIAREAVDGGKQSEKKKTVEDLKKLMNIMEEVVQTSMGGYVDEEIMEVIKNVAHKDQESSKTTLKHGTPMKKTTGKNADTKHSLNRKTPKDKNINQYEKQEYSQKMPVVEEESGGEPAVTDSDEDLGDDGLNIQELLRLKRIINAMGKCGE